MNWKEFSLAKKHIRRTIPINEESSVVIREINVAHGGLGCATWDGGVILARWIKKNKHIWEQATALELGCGVGISGIVAASHARKLTVSDYLPDVMENARYNFQVNLHEEKFRSIEFCMLDWHQFIDNTKTPQTEEHFCTKLEHQRAFIEQQWFTCDKCFDDSSKGVCQPCFDAFHKAHAQNASSGFGTFRCDCTHFHCETKPDISPHSFDIIFGSELIYSPLSCEALASAVDYLLSPNGVFYQLLQEKREGVELFCSRMKDKGFKCYVSLFPSTYAESTNTRSWELKGQENFMLYAWVRIGRPVPTMIP